MSQRSIEWWSTSAAYKNAVDTTVSYMTRTSSLLDRYIKAVAVEGMTPEDIADAVALFTERGGEPCRLLAG